MSGGTRTAPPVRFIILTPARTGSNIIVELLNRQPGCFVGYETFADEVIAKGHIPWYFDDQIPSDRELNELRKADPVRFLIRMYEIAEERGFRTVGFKFTYFEGDVMPIIRDYLAADNSIRVIHNKRKQLLRRYLSLQRAREAGLWWVSAKDDKSVPLPSISPRFMDCIWDFNYVECKEKEYDERFKDHQTLEVLYEDLAADPVRSAARIFEFLNLPPPENLEIVSRKTGTDPLRDAIQNYDELKAHFQRWASFFDE